MKRSIVTIQRFARRHRGGGSDEMAGTAVMRGQRVRRRYLQLRQASVVLQRWLLRRLGQRAARRQQRLAEILQKFYRGQRCRAVVEAKITDKRLADERAVLHMLRERERMWISRSRGLFENPRAQDSTCSKKSHITAVAIDVSVDTRGVYEAGWACQFASLQQQLATQGKAVHAVQLGSAHTVVLANTGEVYSWGWGDRGQLGLGTLGSQQHPTIVERLLMQSADTCGKYNFRLAVKEIAVGDNHTLALSDCGRVFSWGDNRRGQLGYRSGSGLAGRSCGFPRPIDALRQSVTAVACGTAHSVALVKGHVHTWGSAQQLGRRDRTSHGFISGTTAEDSFSPQPVMGQLQFVKTRAIACGASFTVALSHCGDVYTWGAGKHGQLGLGADKETGCLVDTQPLSQKVDFEFDFGTAAEQRRRLSSVYVPGARDTASGGRGAVVRPNRNTGGASGKNKAAGKTRGLPWKEPKWNGFADEFVYPDGSGTYEGRWQNGRWHGSGTVTWRSDGVRWVGEFGNGSAMGRGTFLFPDGFQCDGNIERTKGGRAAARRRAAWVKPSRKEMYQGRRVSTNARGDHLEQGWTKSEGAATGACLEEGDEQLPPYEPGTPPEERYVHYAEGGQDEEEVGGGEAGPRLQRCRMLRLYAINPGAFSVNRGDTAREDNFEDLLHAGLVSTRDEYQKAKANGVVSTTVQNGASSSPFTLPVMESPGNDSVEVGRIGANVYVDVIDTHEVLGRGLSVDFGVGRVADENEPSRAFEWHKVVLPLASGGGKEVAMRRVVGWVCSRSGSTPLLTPIETDWSDKNLVDDEGDPSARFFKKIAETKTHKDMVSQPHRLRETKGSGRQNFGRRDSGLGRDAFLGETRDRRATGAGTFYQKTDTGDDTDGGGGGGGSAGKLSIATKHYRYDRSYAAVHIACGAAHVVAVVRPFTRDTGHQQEIVFTWGNNHHGQLGLGDKEHRCLPTPIMTGDRRSIWPGRRSRVKHIECGLRHSAATTSNGLFFMWGHVGCVQASSRFKATLDPEAPNPNDRLASAPSSSAGQGAAPIPNSPAKKRSAFGRDMGLRLSIPPAGVSAPPVENTNILTSAEPRQITAVPPQAEFRVSHVLCAWSRAITATSLVFAPDAAVVPPTPLPSRKTCRHEREGGPATAAVTTDARLRKKAGTQGTFFPEEEQEEKLQSRPAWNAVTHGKNSALNKQRYAQPGMSASKGRDPGHAAAYQRMKNATKKANARSLRGATVGKAGVLTSAASARTAAAVPATMAAEKTPTKKPCRMGEGEVADGWMADLLVKLPSGHTVNAPAVAAAHTPAATVATEEPAADAVEGLVARGYPAMGGMTREKRSLFAAGKAHAPSSTPTPEGVTAGDDDNVADIQPRGIEHSRRGSLLFESRKSQVAQRSKNRASQRRSTLSLVDHDTDSSEIAALAAAFKSEAAAAVTVAATKATELPEHVPEHEPELPTAAPELSPECAPKIRPGSLASFALRQQSKKKAKQGMEGGSRYGGARSANGGGLLSAGLRRRQKKKKKGLGAEGAFSGGLSALIKLQSPAAATVVPPPKHTVRATRLWNSAGVVDEDPSPPPPPSGRPPSDAHAGRHHDVVEEEEHPPPPPPSGRPPSDALHTTSAVLSDPPVVTADALHTTRAMLSDPPPATTGYQQHQRNPVREVIQEVEQLLGSGGVAVNNGLAESYEISEPQIALVKSDSLQRDRNAARERLVHLATAKSHGSSTARSAASPNHESVREAVMKRHDNRHTAPRSAPQSRTRELEGELVSAAEEMGDLIAMLDPSLPIENLVKSSLVTALRDAQQKWKRGTCLSAVALAKTALSKAHNALALPRGQRSTAM